MHAHLHKNEIIGFLGGTWDPELKRLSVSRALPARQLASDGTDGSVEVELDPESLPPICEVGSTTDCLVQILISKATL